MKTRTTIPTSSPVFGLDTRDREHALPVELSEFWGIPAAGWTVAGIRSFGITAGERNHGYESTVTLSHPCGERVTVDRAGSGTDVVSWTRRTAVSLSYARRNGYCAYEVVTYLD